jgi:hypothetical protein
MTRLELGMFVEEWGVMDTGVWFGIQCNVEWSCSVYGV